ncbi:MAG: A/G-specific adenine glycosylase [Fibrobacteres bacterium]|nr:A/G-specific adenine glycosylase [Fibrobacterota bacterium]
MPPALKTGKVEREAEALAAWFSAGQRDLPWRQPFSAPEALSESGGGPRRDPYRVWIAEIMLQQTQVATVVPYFERWMARFPDVAALAAAAEADVLEAWAGLGYYSRARNILVTARELASRGGVFPDSREGLMALKGIGEYTAGAIASLAFDRPEPILDGNLVRVFSRLYGMAFLPDSKANRAAYWDKAREWAEAHRPGLVNEGLMELGALICTPRNPACDDCPLAAGCVARKEGTQAALPPVKEGKARVDVEGYAVAAYRNAGKGREVLLYTAGKSERLAGLVNFPFFAVPDWTGLREAWKAALPGLAGAHLKPRPATVSHGITHYRYRVRVAEASVEARKAASILPEGYAWVAEEDLGRLLVSSLPRKIWRSLGDLVSPHR